MASKSQMSVDETLKQLSELQQKAKTAILAVNSPDELEKEKISFLGRKSELTDLLKGLKDFDIDSKRIIGEKANQLRIELEKIIDTQKNKVLKVQFDDQLKNEKIDTSMPGTSFPLGHMHPVSQMLERAEDIFVKMGFEIEYPYEVDDDFHIFGTLNFPEGHPARDNFDTFSTVDGFMPIPHTSAMQNRVMKSHEPPIRVIVPGKCFRNEATDARHEHTFFQFEGIYVDKGVNLSHLLGTLKTFFTEFYEREINVKFTPDYFPFVEPGGMMSLTCVLCEGKGCAVCKKTGWLEILGCGMIHPEVLKSAGIDPEVYSGFAWGFGLQRLIMLKYNIEDGRLFNSGNLKFIRQF